MKVHWQINLGRYQILGPEEAVSRMQLVPPYLLVTTAYTTVEEAQSPESNQMNEKVQ